MDGPGLWPSLASLGPPGPPGLPSEIHLTLSASLTESTPIRGKRLSPHPPAHSRSLSPPPGPPRLHGGLHPGPFHVFPPCHPAQCLSSSVSLLLCVAEGPSVTMAALQATWPQGRGYTSHVPPELWGPDVDCCSVHSLVSLQPESSHASDLRVQPDGAETGSLKGQPHLC